MDRVGIVGMGLIGGSIGLALKQQRPGVEVIGVARRAETAALALRLRAADRASTDLATLADADLVILACPLGETAAVLAALAPHLAEGARVTDVGSVKGGIVAAAEATLDNARNPFLGGHPMAGKEVSGIENAHADLFRERPWIFTPGGAGTAAFADLIETVEAFGAVPVQLGAERHDALVALISHVPFLVSAALVNAVAADDGWADARALASSGWRDATRLAAGDVEMYTAIAALNRDQVLRVWDELMVVMEAFAEAIADDQPENLRNLLAGARKARVGWAEAGPGSG